MGVVMSSPLWSTVCSHITDTFLSVVKKSQQHTSWSVSHGQHYCRKGSARSEKWWHALESCKGISDLQNANWYALSYYYQWLTLRQVQFILCPIHILSSYPLTLSNPGSNHSRWLFNIFHQVTTIFCWLANEFIAELPKIMLHDWIVAFLQSAKRRIDTTSNIITACDINILYIAGRYNFWNVIIFFTVLLSWRGEEKRIDQFEYSN